MDVMDKNSHVYCFIGDQIGHIMLNRPLKYNAMSCAMWQAVASAVALLDADPSVRVIVLKSVSDKAFSAGADIGELSRAAEDKDFREQNRRAIRHAQRSLARAKKPTIAAIQGACIGGGCGLAIHCDIRIAAHGSRFGITPAKLGLIYPLSDTRTLIELVGPSHAKLMLYTGRHVTGKEALTMGLIDILVASEHLSSEITATANTIKCLSQYSIRGIKRNIRRVMDGQIDDDDITAAEFNEAQDGIDAAEGLSAFLEKRNARFLWND